MSVTKLNKTSGVAPEKETLEEDQDPPKTLKEIITTFKAIKLEFWEIERYVQQSPSPSDKKHQKAGGGGGVTKHQLEAQVMRIKGEMVQLERILEERLLMGGDEEDEEGMEMSDFEL